MANHRDRQPFSAGLAVDTGQATRSLRRPQPGPGARGSAGPPQRSDSRVSRRAEALSIASRTGVSSGVRACSLGRPTEAPLGRIRRIRCIGTTSARAGVSSNTVAVAMRQKGHSRPRWPRLRSSREQHSGPRRPPRPLRRGSHTMARSRGTRTPFGSVGPLAVRQADLSPPA
jgi:hypothetical protein